MVICVMHMRVILHTVTTSFHILSFQPIGRAFALVQPTHERQPESWKKQDKTELIKPREGQVEVLKVGSVLCSSYAYYLSTK